MHPKCRAALSFKVPTLGFIVTTASVHLVIFDKEGGRGSDLGGSEPLTNTNLHIL